MLRLVYLFVISEGAISLNGGDTFESDNEIVIKLQPSKEDMEDSEVKSYTEEQLDDDMAHPLPLSDLSVSVSSVKDELDVLMAGDACESSVFHQDESSPFASYSASPMSAYQLTLLDPPETPESGVPVMSNRVFSSENFCSPPSTSSSPTPELSSIISQHRSRKFLLDIDDEDDQEPMSEELRQVCNARKKILCKP